MSGNGSVVPGKPVVDAICAASSLGEKILREIAQSRSSLRQRWNFRLWTHGVSRGTVSMNGSEPVPLSLHLYTHTAKMGPRVLVIEEVPGRRLSLKLTRRSDGSFALKLGKDAAGTRISSLACQIVAMYVLHGHGWQDRNGREYFEPHGAEPRNSRRRRKRERREPRQHEYLQPLSDG